MIIFWIGLLCCCLAIKYDQKVKADHKKLHDELFGDC